MAIPTGAQPVYADEALLLVKIESTPGEDSVPTALLNSLLTKSCNVKPVVDMINIDRYGHTFRSSGAVPGKSFFEFDVEVPMVVPVVNTAYLSAPEPRWSPLMQIAGFTATGEQDNTGVNDFFAAIMNSKPQRYQLVDGQTLTVVVDGGAPADATFNTADFADITHATAAEIVTVINADIAGATASAWRGKVIIRTNTTDNTGSIQVTGGTANAELGFATAEVEAYNIVQRWAYTLDSHACQQTATLHFCMFPSCAETDDNYWLGVALGAVANVEMMLARDEECTFKFTGKGAWGGVSTGDFSDLLGAGINYGGDLDAMVGVGASIEFDDYSGASTRTDLFTKLSINLNWDVKERPDQTQERGIRAFYITRKGSITGSYDPEEWVSDIYDRWDAVFGAERQGVEAIYESPIGSRCTIQMPNIQFGSPTINKDGQVRYEQSFYVRDDSDAGDDAITLTFEPQPA